MKRRYLAVVMFFVLLILCCSYFIPKTSSSISRDQHPIVSEYVRTIEGHKYVVIVATNAGGYYNTPSISVTCVHAESCPCKNMPKEPYN